MIARTVQRVHFEDLAGTNSSAWSSPYHLRAGWRGVAWYGQTGSNLGRYIIGVELLGDGPPCRTIIQRVAIDNFRRLWPDFYVEVS